MAYNRFMPLLPSYLEHIQYLVNHIGPRGTGTKGEQKAADYVCNALSRAGIQAERLTCRTIRSMNHYPLIINGMGLLALLLYPLDGGWTRWIAAVLAAMVAPFMALTIRTSSNPLRIFLPKASSPSILAKIEPTESVKRQVVLLSHLDTNKCRLTWKPEGLRRIEPLTYVTLSVQALFGLLYLAGALLGLLTFGRKARKGFVDVRMVSAMKGATSVASTAAIQRVQPLSSG